MFYFLILLHAMIEAQAASQPPHILLIVADDLVSTLSDSSRKEKLKNIKCLDSYRKVFSWESWKSKLRFLRYGGPCSSYARATRAEGTTKLQTCGKSKNTSTLRQRDVPAEVLTPRKNSLANSFLFFYVTSHINQYKKSFNDAIFNVYWPRFSNVHWCFKPGVRRMKVDNSTTRRERSKMQGP